MSEQDQTETKSGGSFAGVVGATAAAVGSGVYVNNKVGDKLVASALDGSLLKDKQGKALEAAGKTITAAENALNQAPLDIRLAALTAKNLNKPEELSKLKEVVISKAKDGTYDAVFNDGVRLSGRIKGIKDLPKDIKVEKDAVTIAGEDLKKLTEGAEKSWVAKTAAVAEKGVIKEVRAAKTFKEAGSIFGQSGFKGKAAIIGVPVLAAVAVGKVTKNMFSSNHVDQVAERAATQDQSAAR